MSSATQPMEKPIDWVPILKKVTTETDNMPYAKTEDGKERKKTTERIWYINATPGDSEFAKEMSLECLKRFFEGINRPPEQ